MMEKIGLTYSGEIKGLENAIIKRNFDINYTIDVETGEPTTTSIFIKNNKDFLMITFNYQDLKKLVESRVDVGNYGNRRI